MKRYLDDLVAQDLSRKMVLVTGPRQVGKTTLCQHLLSRYETFQYLNWDIAADRAILQRESWNPNVRLLALDEVHKRRDWKTWLKGLVDARRDGQAVLVTGSARMETWRQSGESLAGRYFSHRLHPISLREWCAEFGGSPDEALARLMVRGGFPEPCLAATDEEAGRWRRQYFTDLIREDVVEFSRLHEITAMRLFVEILRDRVGSPVSLASISRDLGVAANTLKRYLDILQALFIVFLVPPWHHNIARATRQTPKVYFYDTGLARGNDGARLENAVAAMLLKHVHFLQDAKGKDAGLHYIRTKDGAEIDFCLSLDKELTDLVECTVSETTRSRALVNLGEKFPQAAKIQLVRNLRQEEYRAPVQILNASNWLAKLAA